MGKELQLNRACPQVSLMMLLCMMKDLECYKNFEVPHHTGRVQKDVFAMIKQLGVPTWFCSFSAAETRWVPLLQCLAKLVKQKELTEQETIEMTWQEKCELIKSDPVTCARYFDNRIQCFLNSVLKRHSQPIGEIADYFGRIEFQQRGSPHIHLLVWIKNAPVYGQSHLSDVISFIVSLVSLVSNLCHLQKRHNNSKSC